MNELVLLDVANRAEWRAWLQKNHARLKLVWLVQWKVASGRKTMSYEDAVEEALCFGWIDSTVHSVDERRFARKFTPRTNAALWSEHNIRRFAKVRAEGLVTEAGMRVYAPAAPKKAVQAARVKAVVPQELKSALAKNVKAREFFAGLAQSHKNRFVGWICAAKRPETRARRIAECVATLAKRQKLGVK